MGSSVAAAAERMRAVLPRGGLLTDDSWRARHWMLAVGLLLHVPVLAAVGVTAATGPGLSTLPAVLALGVAVLFGSRRTRSLAVAAGLAWSSGVFVVATGTPAAHLHLGLVVVALALYQAWAPLLLAVAHGVLLMGVVGQLEPVRVFGAEAAAAPSQWALLSVVLVLGAGAVGGAWWLLAERDQIALRLAHQRLSDRERQITDRLAAVEEVKSQLLAVVAHEFRTPLTSITGFARTLSARLHQLDTEAIHACLDGIDHHARRLARLVHNVIAASGDIAIDHTAVTDLAAITRSVAEEAVELHGRRVEIDLALPEQLDAAADPVATRRIIANLCENAVMFSPRGTVVEVVGYRDELRVVVEVSNEARAMSTAALEALFEPFVQADSSDTRAGEGIGLGLHVARRIARAHDGDLVARTGGERVIFTLSLPVPGRLRHRGDEDHLEIVRESDDARA